MATNKTTTKTTTKTTKKPIQNRKSLGKGLDIIFGDDIAKVIKDVESNSNESLKNDIQEVKLKDIVENPYQPRRVFNQEKLIELADSIKENGLLTPIVLKKSKTGKNYIVAGERRFRASKIAKKTTIKSIFIDVSDKKMQELALIENIQRENLNPIEESVAVKKLIEDHKMTHAAAAKILGKSRTYITNSLRLLKLEKRIIDAVLSGKLTFGHAKPLVTLTEKNALIVYERIINEALTVREVENISRGYKLSESKKNSPKKKPIQKSSAIEYAEDLIRNKVKSKVEITNNKIIIKYRGNEQLNRIISRINALEK